jgi:hypothetical protein
MGAPMQGPLSVLSGRPVKNTHLLRYACIWSLRRTRSTPHSSTLRMPAPPGLLGLLSGIRCRQILEELESVVGDILKDLDLHK